MKALCNTMIATLIMVLLTPSIAGADWDPGDGHKMHFPQLPDPNGWDVSWGEIGGGRLTLADDFLCTATGSIDDIHFWLSFQGDDWIGDPSFIGPVTVGIWSDQPAGASYSRPLEPLWQQDFTASEFAFRYYGSGEQGFINPDNGVFANPDHFDFFQINITDIVNPFIQQEDTIYWLSLTVEMDAGMPGWKTSLDHFNDSAVFSSPYSGNMWMPLGDPFSSEPFDLAFVITPEPATLALMTLGGLVCLRRR